MKVRTSFQTLLLLAFTYQHTHYRIQQPSHTDTSYNPEYISDLTTVKASTSVAHPTSAMRFESSIHLLTDPKPMEPSPDISKPKTVWCKSHVQQRSIEEEPPAEMEYKELNRSLPIYTPSIRRHHPRSRIRRRGCPYTTTTKG